MVTFYFLSRILWRSLIIKTNVLVTLVIEIKEFIESKNQHTWKIHFGTDVSDSLELFSELTLSIFSES